MTSNELMWLAGYLEGEGCFHIRSIRHRSPSINAATVDKDIAGKVASLFGAKVSTLKRKTVTLKTVYSVRVGGDRAIELMQLLHPHMGIRRRARIDEVLKLALSRPGFACGERQGVAKLNEMAVQDIRLNGHGRGVQSHFARKYGVSQACVWCVLRGKTWKHVA